MTGSHSADRVVVEVEQALGPGVVFEHDDRLGLVGTSARTAGEWRGLDRAALLDSDDGHGARLAVLAATPASTHVGCRLVLEILGGWRLGPRVALLGVLPGTDHPSVELAATVGGFGPSATWLGPVEAAHEVRLARQRFRERRSHERLRGGRAWRGEEAARVEERRFSTPHSQAEYDLRRLPPRYLRGLEGLLDDDERLLYWIERPEVTDPGIVMRLRGDDRRAALLALTDRQLLWATDHMQPDRFLSDWGVDTESVPVERVTAAVGSTDARGSTLTVTAGPAERRYLLPPELADEVEVMATLLTRFTPAGAAGLPRRVYALEAVPFVDEHAERFGQLDLARELFARAAVASPLACVFSPRREGQRHAGAAVLGPDVVVFADERFTRAVSLSDVIALRCTLSALIGRVGVVTEDGIVDLAYPAPLAAAGTAFARLARRALADTTDLG